MIEVTATLTVSFSYEDDEEIDEEQAKETFLEWIGTVSDNWILEGTKIRIFRRPEGTA